MSRVWIECALNGAWTRERQPAIPVARAEIIADGIAAARAGAAIIHLHAYDETTGRQKDDYDLYAPLIEGIRARVDAIVYPTLPITGSGYAGELRPAKERYAHLDRLARNGLAEWGVIDPGSAVFTRFDEVARGQAGYTYYNPDDHFLEGMRIGAQYGVRPSYAVYEAGCLRLGAAAARAMPRVPTPVYRFMFADEFCFGFPPRPAYLDAHLQLLAESDPGAPWMVAGLGVDIRPLIAPAVARGGHIRIGLEDRPWGVEETNRGLVEEAARLVRAAGGEPATAAEVRAACAQIDAALGRGGALSPTH
ncbi:MAG: 3-keto-5-aminohexanoate cleavage protein [Alphaproteobacteria bacterium]|nr:3-keto-5-aminohexanoate cleavage protein [Alphaproteobacteria bacterium]